MMILKKKEKSYKTTHYIEFGRIDEGVMNYVEGKLARLEILLKPPLSAAGRLLFCLIKKVVKKIKFAVMQNNERLYLVGLKLAFARKRSNNKPP